MPRTLRVALLAFALAPATAHAAPVRMVVRDVPLRAERASALTAPAFNMVGLHWQGPGTPSFRTRTAAGRWSAWTDADDDWGRSGAWRKGNLVWTGRADAIQVRTRGRVTRVREYLLWSPPVRVPQRRLQLTGAPPIVTRAGWDANEEIRKGTPIYAPALQYAIVHHTASTNAYSCLQSASIVRGIEEYHVKGNGWNDIGYNFIVDSCGQVFEGRYGGVDKNVVGAHSQGFNTGSVGVALLGTFGSRAPTAAAQTGLADLLAWRLDVAHVDPLSFTPVVAGGNAKFPAGIPVTLRAVSGHRDTYFTDCPGDALFNLLPALAQRIAKTGGPKLYAPAVTGAPGGQVRFTARLSSALPWTITVVDPAGVTVANASGSGTAIDWTWDAKSALAGAAYSWTIDAGSTVRSATGTLGGKLAALKVSAAKASPQLLDGANVPVTTIQYTLTAAATVTGELLTADGTLQAPLFTQALPAGPQTYVLGVSDLPDGNYTVHLSARDALGRSAQAFVPVTVSRVLGSFSPSVALLSPNGDGRRDTVTFRVALLQPASVTITLDTRMSSYSIVSADLPGGATHDLAFTGASISGQPVPDGKYTALLTVEANGTRVTVSAPLTIDTAAPSLTLVSLNPLRLKTGEAATAIARVNGRHLRTSARPGTFRLGPKQEIRTLYVVLRDAAGNESEPVRYVRKR